MTDHPRFLTAPFHSDSILAVESTRQGGFSQPPYSSLNLGLFTLDDPKAIERNLNQYCVSLGIDRSRLALSRQVHSDQIIEVMSPGQVEGYDAMITNLSDIFLGIGTADCCPVLIWDPVQQAVGAVHAGWRGTALQILPKTIHRMTSRFESNPADLWIYLGTCISWSHYEIGEEIADQFPDVFLRPGKEEGKYLLDMKGCLFAQALAAGIRSDHVTSSTHCSYAEPDLFYSYRRDGSASGRMMSIVGMRGIH